MNDFNEEELFEELYNNPSLYKSLEAACKKNELNKVKYILDYAEYKKSDDFYHSEGSMGLITKGESINICCESDSLDCLKYLLSFYKNANIYFYSMIEKGLLKACSKGHLKIIDYLLSSNNFDLKIKSDDSLFYACSNNKVEVLDYLLKHEKLKEYKEICIKKGMLLFTACEHGSLDIIKFLLNTELLKDKIDINVNKDQPFEYLLSYGRMEIIQYLIFEHNITKTDEISKLLKKFDNKEVEKWFNMRDTNNELVNELNNNNNNNQNKRIKL